MRVFDHSFNTVVLRRSLLVALLVALACAALPTAVAATGKSVIKGTNKGERIVGTKEADRINARGGKDRVLGKGGGDRIKAGPGKDKVKSGSGKDKVKGNAGKDKLVGGGGKDKLAGGGGGDKLLGGGGPDKLLGGGGDDKLNAIDGAADAKINGGKGKDICKVDPEDVANVTGCEKVFVKGGGGSDPDPGPGPGPDPGPDPAPNAPLVATSGAFICPLGPVLGIPAICTFNLAGTGADAASGTVAAGGGVANPLGSAQAGDDGAWTAVGTATCTADGTLTVGFGAETVAVPATCSGAAGGGGGADGLLTIVAGDPISCTAPVSLPPLPTVPGVCPVTLAGTGADAPGGAGTIGSTGGVSPDGIVAASPGGDAWTASGPASCTSSGTITVTFGPETVTATVNCG